MSLSDSMLTAFWRGGHGDSQVVATMTEPTVAPRAPLLTPATLAALGQEPPPTLEQRVAALEERLAQLEQQA